MCLCDVWLMESFSLRKKEKKQERERERERERVCVKVDQWTVAKQPHYCS